MRMRVKSVLLNVEGVCSFLPTFCLRLGNRFIVVSGQRGLLRGGVCGSVGLHIRKVVFSSFFTLFLRLSGKALWRLKGSRYRNYRLYSSCFLAERRV